MSLSNIFFVLGIVEVVCAYTNSTPGITSNAILIANKYCPISFRTVDSVDYKKAMLIFYEHTGAPRE